MKSIYILLLIILLLQNASIAYSKKIKKYSSRLSIECEKNLSNLQKDNYIRTIFNVEGCENRLPADPTKITRLLKDNFKGSGHNMGLGLMEYLNKIYENRLIYGELLESSITDDDLEQVKSYLRKFFYTKENFPRTYRESLVNNFELTKTHLASFFNKAQKQHLPYIKKGSNIIPTIIGLSILFVILKCFPGNYY